MKRERVFARGLELRSMSDGQLPSITGLAAPFGKPSELISDWFDTFFEIIEPTYFDSVLSDPNLDVRCFKNHNEDLIMGRYKPSKNIRSLSLDKDSEGLRVTLQPVNNQTGRDLVADIEAGLIDGMSIGHWVAEDNFVGTYNGFPVRRLVRCQKIDDVSFVVFPAYPDTTAEVRSKLYRSGDMSLEEYGSYIKSKLPNTVAAELEIKKRKLQLIEIE